MNFITKRTQLENEIMDVQIQTLRKQNYKNISPDNYLQIFKENINDGLLKPCYEDNLLNKVEVLTGRFEFKLAEQLAQEIQNIITKDLAFSIICTNLFKSAKSDRLFEKWTNESCDKINEMLRVSDKIEDVYRRNEAIKQISVGLLIVALNHSDTKEKASLISQSLSLATKLSLNSFKDDALSRIAFELIAMNELDKASKIIDQINDPKWREEALDNLKQAHVKNAN